jgi:hypothetical protein
MSLTRYEPPPKREDVLLEELRAVRRELAAQRRLWDEFMGTFLNSKFPYGRPVDRWRPRG